MKKDNKYKNFKIMLVSSVPRESKYYSQDWAARKNKKCTNYKYVPLFEFK